MDITHFLKRHLATKLVKSGMFYELSLLLAIRCPKFALNQLSIKSQVDFGTEEKEPYLTVIPLESMTATLVCRDNDSLFSQAWKMPTLGPFV